MIADVARSLHGAADADLTVELITHRFTAGSKSVLESWYPGSSPDLGSANRTEKRTKSGSIKHVYDATTMRRLALAVDDGEEHVPLLLGQLRQR